MSWIDTDSGGANVCNKRELSEILGVSDQSLTEWQDEGMPVLERGGPGVSGKYETAAVIRWAVRRELSRRNSVSAKDRLDEIRAKRELLGYEKDIGSVVTVEEIRPAFQRYVGDVLGTLLALPERYAPTLELTPGIDGKVQVLEDLVAELRDVIGNYEFCAMPAAIGTQGITKSAALFAS